VAGADLEIDQGFGQQAHPVKTARRAGGDQNLEIFAVFDRH
jgi:hypothetical protein